MTHIPDECIGRVTEVVQEVYLASFKRVRYYDRHPRPLKFTDQLDLAEDVLTCLDWAARRWYGHGVTEVSQ